MRSFSWRSSAILLVGSLGLASACSEDKIALSIDLRTDFVPGTEFTSVITEVVPDGSIVVTKLREVNAAESDFVSGTRIADFGGLPPGGFSVKVRVFSEEGAPLVERLARVSVTGNYALTMVVTRSCEGVVCPVPEGDPSKSTCSGGQCVQPECLPERPESCPSPQCAADADCKSTSSCVQASCKAGTCLFVPDASKCAGGTFCDVTQGCVLIDADACKPSSPTETACDDGVDDDCDGKIDCADPDCNAKPCDDENKCTDGDTCQKGVCTGGKPLDCDDDESCTDDTCDPLQGCVSTPRSTGLCDDSNACTSGDHCEAGKCVAGSTSSCDDQNPCTDDTCDAEGGCLHTPNTAPCDDGNACTEGDVCADKACKPGKARTCDDKNPCTDDTCDPLKGCTTTSNTAPCDDKVFCNGADTCSQGACTAHAGNPCGGGKSCDAASDKCNSCDTNADCGNPIYGTWSECGGFQEPCGMAGMRTRTVTTPTCAGNACQNTQTTETEACMRDTEESACGTVTKDPWGACTYPDECVESVVQSRNVHTPTCKAGTCTDVVTPETQTCTRQTDGQAGCKATVTGAWTACDYNACAAKGTRSRKVTTYACASGVCKGTTVTDPDTCTRTQPANGTGCGTGKYCCSGSCVAKGGNNNCGSCGIDCGSRACKGIGNGHYACDCATNSYCQGIGYGGDATCYQSVCNCQGNGSACKGGSTCHVISGNNYCGY